MTTETPPCAESTTPEENGADADVLRPFAFFVGGTLAFSWGLWALPFVDLVPSSALGILARVGGFGPLVGALVALYATGRSIREWVRSNVRVRIPVQWFGWALVLPSLVIGLAGVVHVVVFGASVDLEASTPVWFYPVAVVVVFFVGGGQEELGWRGFALPALQQRFSALVASIGVGIVWFCWHLPLYFLPGSAQTDLPLVPYAVALLCTSIVLTWLYNSSGSVLVPMLYHGGINPIAAYFPTGGVRAVETVSGYGSYTLILAVAAGVLLASYGSRQLSNRPRMTLSTPLSSKSTTDR